MVLNFKKILILTIISHASLTKCADANAIIRALILTKTKIESQRAESLRFLILLNNGAHPDFQTLYCNTLGEIKANQSIIKQLEENLDSATINRFTWITAVVRSPAKK